ncbi:unnamed protein product, partial [Polarella glacialis]
EAGRLRELLGELEQELPEGEVKQKLLQSLGQACGKLPGAAPPQLDVWTISEELGCRIFASRDTLGRGIQEQNRHYGLENHIEMVQDTVRVAAFASAIHHAVALGSAEHVLDVGSGAFCLLARIALKAGARIVHATEQNTLAVEHAVELFKMELADVPLPPVECLRSTCAALWPDQMQLVIPASQHARSAKRWNIMLEPESLGGAGAQQQMGGESPKLVSLVSREFPNDAEQSSSSRPSSGQLQVMADSLRCTLRLWPTAESLAKEEPSMAEQPAVLELYQGLTCDLPLSGQQYDMVVHEILGHVASAEGVAATIADLIDRRVCRPGCIFVPAAAGTFFAPTAALELSPL